MHTDKKINIKRQSPQRVVKIFFSVLLRVLSASMFQPIRVHLCPSVVKK